MAFPESLGLGIAAAGGDAFLSADDSMGMDGVQAGIECKGGVKVALDVPRLADDVVAAGLEREVAGAKLDA